MKLINRYIASQYFEVLVLATLMIGSIFLGTAEYQKMLSLICNVGMDWHKALLVSSLQIPSMFIFALPAGTLIATILVLYRLNGDGELLALKMAGASHMRLMMPFFALSVAASVISFSLSEFVQPTALSTAAQLLRMASIYSRLPVTKSSITIMEPIKNKTNEAQEARLMLIGRYLDSALKNVVIFDLVDNQVNVIHWAATGKWFRGQWQLLGGRTYSLKQAEGADPGTSSFGLMVIDTLASKVQAKHDDGPIPEHKTMAQLKVLIDQFRAEHKAVPVDVLIDYYHRVSQPLACLLLVIAAFPIALGNHRRGHSAGMIYGGLMTTAYFLIQEVTLSMGYSGRLEPLVAVWLPCVSLVTIGLAVISVKLTRQTD